MRSIGDIQKEYQDQLDDVDTWIKEEYNENFEQYFKNIKELYSRLSSTSKPVTDKELEEILSSVPLQLFSAAEALNFFKAKLEVLKMNVKSQREEAMRDNTLKTQADRKHYADVAVYSGELLIKVYSTIVERVEREMSYSRELIMSAKKIWTARKEEEVNARLVEPTSPTKHVNPPLPEYGSSMPETYIK